MSAELKVVELKQQTASFVDAHVGSRVRWRRMTLGLSLEWIGQALGVSYQQIQKYEGGTTRISASALFDLAHILEVSVDYFFADMPHDTSDYGAGSDDGNRMSGHGQEGYNQDPRQREVTELARNFRRIPDPDIRSGVLQLVNALASSS
jgi:transcriptional regulator with XRE-family HTH domain